MGLAETHQTLVLNNLRSRVVLQVDGQIRTAFDVLVAALLGADEFAFSTAPLIALGCTMMRKCHLNTCPVGIATQDPVLRAKFKGQPEHVINYLFLLAEDIRKEMAKMGVAKFQHLIGRSDWLSVAPHNDGAGKPEKARLLCFDKLLRNALHMRPGVNIVAGSTRQDFGLDQHLDHGFIEQCRHLLQFKSAATPPESNPLRQSSAAAEPGPKSSPETRSSHPQKSTVVKEAGATLKVGKNPAKRTPEAKDSLRRTPEAKDLPRRTPEAKDSPRRTSEAKDLLRRTPEAKDSARKTAPEAKDSARKTAPEAKDSPRRTLEAGKNAPQVKSGVNASKDSGKSPSKITRSASGASTAKIKAIAIKNPQSSAGIPAAAVASAAANSRDLYLGPVVIGNKDRAFGTLLSYHIAKTFGGSGLPDATIHIRLTGSAGQSFCAFLASGVHVTLHGDANDYVAKGLCGGRVVIRPPENCGFTTQDNVIAGNACLYGATSGSVFLRGSAAERFCVRNSGATAVVEGVGDHGCEYMTGGIVVILGETGRNFAAGMSGGIAYVHDPHLRLAIRCNTSSVKLIQCDDHDLKLLESLLRQFHTETRSQVSADLLKDWPSGASAFVKVLPYEYEAALKKRQAEQHHPVADIEDCVADAKRSGLPESAAGIDRKLAFVRYDRENARYRNADKRLNDWHEIYDRNHIRKGLRVQAARCMDCGVAFCQSSYGCPLGNVIPKWNDLIFRNEWKEALHQLLLTNNFPEFTGRVCPAPCESACVLAIHSPAVTIKSIECAIIDHAFERGWIVAEHPETRTGKKVAIVGSGPAALACAHQLNKVTFGFLSAHFVNHIFN